MIKIIKITEMDVGIFIFALFSNHNSTRRERDMVRSEGERKNIPTPPEMRKRENFVMFLVRRENIGMS